MLKKLDASGDNKWRVVIDFNVLNKKVVSNTHPVPNVMDIPDQLGEARYFFAFNLASGFHQVTTHEREFVLPCDYYPIQ